MKASLAISSEIVLDRLLEKLMHILVENAGARKGYLLLKEAEKLVVVAERNKAERPWRAPPIGEAGWGVLCHPHNCR